MPYIGQSVPRVDARSKVTGQAVYASDITMPGQAYLKVLMAHRPHAIVKRVDVSQAEAVPGVIAVLTSRDVPCNEFGYYSYDQPVLCGPCAKPYADRVRYVGDRVAAVVAESEEIAAAALQLITVDYEDLPVVCDVEEALLPEAIVLHPDQGSNLFGTHILHNGDMEEGFRQADVVVEAVYNTPAQEHAYLQTEAGLAYIDEQRRVTIVTTGQWGAKDRKQVAHSLCLPEEQVRVIYPMTGGAFGGREDISVQIIVALAALKLHQCGTPRPVRVVWSREESILAHCKRHPFRIFTKWGATKDGKITAAEVKILADGGAYKFTTSIVTSNSVINCTGPYEIPNVKVDAYDVYTNNVPRGAFRGFGGPQGAYVAEQQVNKLAAALGMDPVELRMRNLVQDGSLQSTGAPFPPGVSIRPVTEQCALGSGWRQTAEGWVHPVPVQTQYLASGLVETQNHASGLIETHNHASGLVETQNLASGLVETQNLASGLVETHNHASGLVETHNHASGLVETQNLASGLVETQNLASGLVETHNHASGLAETQNLASLQIRRGTGIACAHKNVGFSYGYPESCTVGIELYGGTAIERAVIRHGASEVGMGAHTVITQMAADALGISMEQVELISTDTAEVKDSGAVSASRMTFFIGNALKEGSEIALRRWQDEERPVRLFHTYLPHQTTSPDPITGQCDPNVAYSYTAQAVEVAVDMETGRVVVEKIICAIDVGKAINPQQVLGQIQGGLIQSLGYAVMENFIEKDGRVLTPSLSTYLVPTIADIPPEIKTIVLETPDPRGPWGARGLGEVMNMCLAPAVAAAVHAATGVWFDEFPLYPERVLRGLGKID